jgi:small-conductance mechanosensitive channel|tara:strand:+ start:118 stop:1047 length:930 start_codon:yes stop_codon:yes gene_type:complete
MKRLLFPILTLVFLVSLLLFSDGITAQFSKNFKAVTGVYLRYGLQAAIWLSGAHVATRLLEVVLWGRIAIHLLGKEPPKIFKDIVTLLVFTVAVSGIVATVLDRSITGLWATSGILGLVTGFALKDMILDIACGIALQMEKPFAVGDWIEIQGNRPENHVVARVKEINWRTTRLKTTGKNLVVVPNRKLCDATITNFRAEDPTCRVDLFFVFDPSLSHDAVSEVLLGAMEEAADGEKILLSPEPEVRLGERNLAGQMYESRFFFSSMHLSPGMAKDLGMRAIMKALRDAGIQTARGLLPITEQLSMPRQ